MEKEKIIDEIIESHRQLNRALRDYSPDVWLDLSLTIAQVKSLFFISNQGSTNFRKLAERLKVTPSNVTGIIDRLVEQGLISRTENPTDRRMMTLKTTEKGDALVAELRERRSSFLSKALTDLSPDELNTVEKGLTILAKAAEEYNQKSMAE
jgi:MarR family transcriptional regulator, organic hydroperoxide resistance regulator